jgi:zinc transport system ATP-binding protein
MNAVSIKELNFSYGKNKVLEDVNLTIPSCSLIGIVGPNGGGKTTLLNLIMGFLEPTSGAVSVLDRTSVEARSMIGYVPQVSTFDVLFPITVLEVVLMGALKHRSFMGNLSVSWTQKAKNLLKTLGLECKAHENFFSLSGGQAQRVLIARALLTEPQLLILDEPTANVDSENEKILFNILKDLKKSTTILMVSHSLRTLTQEVDGAILVNKTTCFLKPQELCQHYSLGIFHPPIQIKKS